ncbi:MAG: TIGR04255 family protein [Methylomonas sp.]|jgi:uncharacterized protein (TIGR04255 family)
MTTSLGAWSNAPLAYVLAEVRTEQIADLKNYQKELAGRLREEYPIQRAKHSATIIAANTGVIFQTDQDDIAWEFATPDNKIAIILRANGIILHATKYKDSKNFLNRLHEVLKIVAEVVPSVYINRLGLRYIDFILPTPREKISQYIDPRLDPSLEIENTLPIATTSLAVYQKPTGTLTLRFVRGYGIPELPPDLGAFSLTPSHLMSRDDIMPNQHTAILDTDRIFPYSPIVRLNPDLVIENLSTLRNDIANLFKVSITDYARKIWGAT